MPVIPKNVALQSQGVLFNMPFQFLMGMDKSVLKYVEDCVPNDVVRIDLMSNTVWQGEEDDRSKEMPHFPTTLYLKLYQLYCQYGGYLNVCMVDGDSGDGSEEESKETQQKAEGGGGEGGGGEGGGGATNEEAWIDEWIHPPDSPWNLTDMEKTQHAVMYVCNTCATIPFNLFFFFLHSSLHSTFFFIFS